MVSGGAYGGLSFDLDDSRTTAEPKPHGGSDLYLAVEKVSFVLKRFLPCGAAVAFVQKNVRRSP